MRSLQERLQQAQTVAEEATVAHDAAMTELRSQISLLSEEKDVEAVAAPEGTPSDTDEAVAAAAGSEAATEEALARAESEIVRLQAELQQAEEAVASAGRMSGEREREEVELSSSRLELERESARADLAVADAGSLKSEIETLKERLRLAERAANGDDDNGGKGQVDSGSTAAAGGAEKEKQAVGEENRKHEEIDGKDAKKSSVIAEERTVPDLVRVALEVEIADREKSMSAMEKEPPEEMTTTEGSGGNDRQQRLAEGSAKEQSLKAALARAADLEEEIARVKLALHQAEEKTAAELTLPAAAGETCAAASLDEETRASLEERLAMVTDRAAVLEKDLAASKLALHEAQEAGAVELEKVTQALRAAEAETNTTREGAGSQAEELSARLMGALEEREEGRRREEAGRKEVDRLIAELAEMAAGLESAKEEAGVVGSRVADLENKLESADRRAEESEAGALGVVKSLEQALTKVEEKEGV